MKVFSGNKLPTYQVIGAKLRIHWDEQEVTKETDEGAETLFSYEEACVPVQASRSTVIEAIMATKYPTPGAEFAALQNGPEAVAEHQAMRVLAKSLYDAEAIKAEHERASLFERQLADYKAAVKRLAQYKLSEGLPEITEFQDGEQMLDEEGMPLFDENGPVYEQVEVVIRPAIEPLEPTVEETTYDEDGNATTQTVPNPLIVKDYAQREAAQAVIDATPSEVKEF